MFNRWFLLSVALATAGGLAFVIWLDSREADSGYDAPARDTGLAGASGYEEAPANPELGQEDQERVAYVTSALDTLESERTRLPYMGELIRIYSEAGKYDRAAELAHQRASLTGESDDWKEAGTFFLQSSRAAQDDEKVKHLASNARTMYQNARENDPDNPDILTDLSVVYMTLLEPESSYRLLQKALDDHPDHIRANFNLGVLLHQMGETDQSVGFLNRSHALAEGSEWEGVVQGYLDRYHDELFH